MFDLGTCSCSTRNRSNEFASPTAALRSGNSSDAYLLMPIMRLKIGVFLSILDWCQEDPSGNSLRSLTKWAITVGRLEKQER